MKILLADGHQLFNEGFSLLLHTLFQNSLITQTTDWSTAKKLAQNITFDLAIVELFMPSDNQWDQELAELVASDKTKAVCIVSSSLNQDNIHKAFAAGAKGYIHKSSSIDELHKALKLVTSQKVYLPAQLQKNQRPPLKPSGPMKLTIRQRRVLSMMAEGKTNRTIAADLGIKESTVKRHVYNICQLLKASNRTTAVHVARQHGLLNE